MVYAYFKRLHAALAQGVGTGRGRTVQRSLHQLPRAECGSNRSYQRQLIGEACSLVGSVVLPYVNLEVFLAGLITMAMRGPLTLLGTRHSAGAASSPPA